MMFRKPRLNLLHVTLVLLLFSTVTASRSSAQQTNPWFDFIHNEANFPEQERSVCQIFRDFNKSVADYNKLTYLQRAQTSQRAPVADDLWTRVHALLGKDMTFTNWHGQLSTGNTVNGGVRLVFRAYCNAPSGFMAYQFIDFESGGLDTPAQFEGAGPLAFSSQVVQYFTKTGLAGAGAEVSGRLFPSTDLPQEWFASAVGYTGASSGPYLTSFTKYKIMQNK